MKHDPDARRHTAVGNDLRTLAAVMARTIAMIAIAILLILVLLPAVLAASAASGA